MTTVAWNHPDSLSAESQPARFHRVGAVEWLQRGLLGLLVIAHVVYPFWLGNKSDLLRDTVILAQVTVFLVLLVMGGLSLLGKLALILVAAIPAARWYFVFPDYLHEYAGYFFLPTIVCSAAALLALRLYGYRGTWREEDFPPAKLQISILSLLMLTTLVAGTLAGANVIRSSNDVNWSSDWRLWGNVIIDGVTKGTLTGLVVWSVGRRGSPLLRLSFLFATLLFLAACNIYAFQMEGYWHLQAATDVVSGLMTVGSLLICRVCGWHVVLPRRDNPLPKGNG